MAVRDHRAPLLHGEDLAAEDQARRQARHLPEVDRQAPGPVRGEVHPGGHPVEVEGLQQRGQVHAAVEVLQRLLEVDVLERLVLQVAADRVELLEPVVDDRPHVGAEEAVSGQALDQGQGGQRLQGAANARRVSSGMPVSLSPWSDPEWLTETPRLARPRPGRNRAALQPPRVVNRRSTCPLRTDRSRRRLATSCPPTTVGGRRDEPGFAGPPGSTGPTPHPAPGSAEPTPRSPKPNRAEPPVQEVSVNLWTQVGTDVGGLRDAQCLLAKPECLPIGVPVDGVVGEVIAGGEQTRIGNHPAAGPSRQAARSVRREIRPRLSKASSSGDPRKTPSL